MVLETVMCPVLFRTPDKKQCKKTVEAKHKKTQQTDPQKEEEAISHFATCYLLLATLIT